MIIPPVTFKVKFMFELAILCIVFNMATSNTNKMSIHNIIYKFNSIFTALLIVEGIHFCISYNVMSHYEPTPEKDV